MPCSASTVRASEKSSIKNDFDVYQRLLWIFVAVSVIKLISVHQCFMVCADNHLKGVVVNLTSPDVSRLLTFVYKHRQFVPIYSEVIGLLQ